MRSDDQKAETSERYVVDILIRRSLNVILLFQIEFSSLEANIIAKPFCENDFERDESKSKLNRLTKNSSPKYLSKIKLFYGLFSTGISWKLRNC